MSKAGPAAAELMAAKIVRAEAQRSRAVFNIIFAYRIQLKGRLRDHNLTAMEGKRDCVTGGGKPGSTPPSAGAAA
jgi:hypothetical protein